MSSDDADADTIWLDAVRAAGQRGITAGALGQEFQDWAGLPPEEASAAELLAFLNRGSRDAGPAETRQPPPPFQLDPVDNTDDWFRVSGAALSQPVDVRLVVRSGRPRVVGIRVDNDQEVTADFLREIRLGRITQEVLSWKDPGPQPDLTGVKFKERHTVLEGWLSEAMLYHDLPEVGAGETTAAKRGTPPPDSALRNFARILMQKRTTKPHGAMAAAAREAHIARSTAYRWAELCRERGYLPQEDDQDD